MYKAAVRALLRRTIRNLNRGDARLAVRMFAPDVTLAFPGDNSLSRQFREPRLGREATPTHRGRDEFAAFLKLYVDRGMQMVVEDILVNGPPWNTRVAVRVHHWIPGPDGVDDYTNRSILWAHTVWGRVRAQEDYSDTQRTAAWDARQPT
jgi:ketosteroid isomerase-like protein